MNLFGKIKKNKALKAGVGYTVGNYLLKGISFLTVPIFARIMDTDDFGIYSTYMSYDAIMAVVIGFALHSSLKNAKYLYKEKFDDYISSIMLLPIAFLAVLLGILNLFPAPFVNLLKLNRFILNLMLIQAFSGAIVQVFNNKIGLEYDYKSFLKVSFINTVTNLLLSILLMYTLFSNERYTGRIIGGVVPLFFIAIYIFYTFFKKRRPAFNREYWKFGLSYSLPIVPHGLSQIILSSFDKIMIRNMIGDSEAGIYSLGITIENIVKVTTTSLDTVWGPWFYERMEEKDYKTIRQVSTYYAYGIFVLLSCLMIAAPEIVWIMGSEAYRDAKYVVVPLLNCTYFTFLYTLPATIEYYFKKTKMIAIGTMGAAALNVILNTICIRRFGYQAAAYTTLTAYFLYFLFHYIIGRRILGFQLFNTKILVLFIAGVFLVNAFSCIFITHFWLRLVVGVLFLAVNLLIAYKLIYPQITKMKKG